MTFLFRRSAISCCFGGWRPRDPEVLGKKAFSDKAVLRIAEIGTEGFGMSSAYFNKLTRLCGCTEPRESAESCRQKGANVQSLRQLSAWASTEHIWGQAWVFGGPDEAEITWCPKPPMCSRLRRHIYGWAASAAHLRASRCPADTMLALSCQISHSRSMAANTSVRSGR